jgi:hypothetical protein
MADLISSRRTENRDLTQAEASRHLSASIASKRIVLTVKLTVKILSFWAEQVFTVTA